MMDWKKIAPWNWFKEEEPPARSTQIPARAHVSSDPFVGFGTEMERLFDETFRRSFPALPWRPAAAGRNPAPLQPSVDISEGKKAYTVRAEIPGVELEDVSIEVEDNTLVIRAEKRQETDEEKEGYHCVERSYGAMQRVLSLPDDADGEAIEAKFRNGVLKLKIPKHPARASKSRSIEIEAS
ncbi:MAG: Hsp20/alpha crystallin family protein [Deltaproteobacteria bacterium]|nr:Hsp20/alpha crystallin family protein [Deltaproteobacteria bacterium]